VCIYVYKNVCINNSLAVHKHAYGVHKHECVVHEYQYVAHEYQYVHIYDD